MTDKTNDGKVIQGVLNVSKEDQTKINKFARLNARLEDIQEQEYTKGNELRNYQDAYDEAEMKVLEGEGSNLHLQIGEIMINLDPEKTPLWIEEKIKALKDHCKELKERRDNIIEEMSQLKSHLYAKFGDNIHLESGP